MTFTSPTVEIGVQPNVMPYSYKCSGTINAGQGVTLVADMEVKAPATGVEIASGCVGVADYKKTDGEWIGIYGPGAIVNVIISGTGKCGHGQRLYCTGEGKFTQADGLPVLSGVSAIALEDQATNNGTAKVLLV